MNKKMSLLVASIALVGITALSIAGSMTAHAPLYTLRMEQVSNKMGFLPTEMNGFTYTAESGHTLNWAAAGCCSDVKPLSTSPGSTYCESCIPETCEESCEWTCFETCPYTCSTCQGQGHTCDNTSCQATCWDTCWYTCCTCKYCQTTEPSCL